MPKYEYLCRSCGLRTYSQSRTATPCPACDDILKRVYSFSVASTFQPHFNHSVGKYVSNRQQFVDELKKAGEKQSERTGTYHNYEPTEIRDIPRTDEGLDETFKRRRDAGIDEPTKRTFT